MSGVVSTYDALYPERPRTEGMRYALAALKARLGAPCPDDAPPPSTFPMTPAARAAVRLDRERIKCPSRL